MLQVFLSFGTPERVCAAFEDIQERSFECGVFKEENIERTAENKRHHTHARTHTQEKGSGK